MTRPVVEKRLYTSLMDVYRRRPVYVPFLNTLIRTTLIAKARLDHAVVSRRAVRRREDIERWLSEHRFFFGFAVPRSGTMFLARLLNSVSPRNIVQHEPNVDDYYHQARAIQSQSEAKLYIERYRLAEIYFRLRGLEFDVYGEINPFLRRHCRALVEVLPAARIFHLVRDGRDVVRSQMSRELYAPNDPMAELIRPHPDDPYHGKWGTMRRFDKLCWLWQEDNRFIRESVPHTVKFERLLTDYDYFRGELLDHIGLSVPESEWTREVSRIENRTPEYRMPAYDSWSADEKSTFARICGAEMEANGYPA